MVHSIMNTCLDVVLFGLPVWIVYTTMIFDPKAIKVILVFSFGFLAVITGITKTSMYLTTDFRTDTFVSIHPFEGMTHADMPSQNLQSDSRVYLEYYGNAHGAVVC